MIHNPQSGGIHLPALTNPAGAAQILSGYQAINADGEIVTGTAEAATIGAISGASLIGAPSTAKQGETVYCSGTITGHTIMGSKEGIVIPSASNYFIMPEGNVFIM